MEEYEQKADAEENRPHTHYRRWFFFVCFSPNKYIGNYYVYQLKVQSFVSLASIQSFVFAASVFFLFPSFSTSCWWHFVIDIIFFAASSVCFIIASSMQNDLFIAIRCVLLVWLSLSINLIAWLYLLRQLNDPNEWIIALFFFDSSGTRAHLNASSKYSWPNSILISISNLDDLISVVVNFIYFVNNFEDKPQMNNHWT